MCFYIRRPPKTLRSTFFHLPHIKVENTPEDKVKYGYNSGLWKARVVAQNSTNDKYNKHGLPLTSLVQPCEVS